MNQIRNIINPFNRLSNDENAFAQSMRDIFARKRGESVKTDYDNLDPEMKEYVNIFQKVYENRR